MNNNKLILILFLLLFFNSCQYRKNNIAGNKIKNYSAQVLVDSLNKTNVNYTWLKNKANATLIFKNEKTQLKSNFRLKKDSLIWLNLSKAGVQVLTCVVSKDSVKFLKKIDKKEYFSGGYEDVKTMIGVELDFNVIQSFLNGSALMLDTSEKYNCEIANDSYLLSSYKSRKINKILKSSKTKNHKFLYRCWINPENFKCSRIELNLLEENITIITEYSNWEEIKNQVFPLSSTLTYININDTMKLDLQYNNNFKLNSPVSFPFKVTKNYSPYYLNTNE